LGVVLPGTDPGRIRSIWSALCTTLQCHAARETTGRCKQQHVPARGAGGAAHVSLCSSWRSARPGAAPRRARASLLAAFAARQGHTVGGARLAPAPARGSRQRTFARRRRAGWRFRSPRTLPAQHWRRTGPATAHWNPSRRLWPCSKVRASQGQAMFFGAGERAARTGHGASTGNRWRQRPPTARGVGTRRDAHWRGCRPPFKRRRGHARQQAWQQATRTL